MQNQLLLSETYVRRVSVIGFCLFVLTSYFSNGYHHPDEHFQILEFCNYKLGYSSAADLPWEFQEQIRPGLPIFLIYGVIQLLHVMGISDPFLAIFILRLLVAVTAWWAMRSLALLLMPQFKTLMGQKLFFAAIFFLWFVPYTSVRYSFENLSSIAILASLILLLRAADPPKRNQALLLLGCGLLMAVSFYLRFQMVLVLIGAAGWMLFVQKAPLKQFILLLVGAQVGLLLNILVDYWFYENLVFSPLNYFTLNLLEGVSSSFGVSPWWNYFSLFLTSGFLPLNLILLLLFLLGSFKNSKNLLVWCMLPFLIGHFAIGHKELRFLFPILFLFITLSMLGVDALFHKEKRSTLRTVFLTGLIVLNLPLLIYRCFAPASENVNYYQFLYNHNTPEKIELYCYGYEFYSEVSLTINYYKSSNVTTHYFPDRESYLHCLRTEQPAHLYVYEIEPIWGKGTEHYQEKVLYSRIPGWVTRFNINNWVPRTKVFKIKELTRIAFNQPSCDSIFDRPSVPT